MDRKNLMQNAVIRANLPGEKIPGTSLVELFGNNRVLIENHCGIVGYSDRKVCVRCVWGEINVEGIDLRIACMTKQQLIILGAITSIYLDKRR